MLFKKITNHFFKKKIPYNLKISNFWKWINYYQIQQFVYKNFVLESEKMIHDLLESHNFLKFGKKR